jgi:hypothetical protein
MWWLTTLADRLRLIAQWANIDPAPLVEQASAVTTAIDSGSPRELDRLLRTLCPDQIWDWPAYMEYTTRVGEKPTRIRMVAALAHRIQRDDHFSLRIPQLLRNIDNRPLWQFRAAGDSLDLPACTKLTGCTERHDSDFWKTNNPAECEHVMCRCTIRAYGVMEWENHKSG